ncbi:MULTISPECIES: hypothetical protein [Fervidicoccus]|uniref:hypothetical protein n=1 Tax=Fervidicoccus TaxID=685950 RepID=UPI0011E4E721|nr:hypothetical protein [Fervidicoccus fontis]
MCRLFGFIGDPGFEDTLYKPTLHAFVSSSYEDPYAANIFKRANFSHKEGWGVFTALINGRKVSYSIRKSLHPVYIDKPNDKLLNSEDERYYRPFAVKIFHARATSEKSTVNILNVQPFEFMTTSGSRLIIAHNGAVDKQKLIGMIDEKESYKKIFEKYSDTYVMGKYLSSIIQDDIKHEQIKNLKEFTLSALNISLVLLNEEKIQVVFGNYYVNDEEKDYYKLYVKNLRDALVFSSSTAVDFYLSADDKQNSGWFTLNNGDFYKFEVNYSKKIPKLEDLTVFNIR